MQANGQARDSVRIFVRVLRRAGCGVMQGLPVLAVFLALDE